MRYQIDENTIWEDTGQIKIYPAMSSRTLSYYTKLYREYKKGSLDSKEVEGGAIYRHNLPIHMQAFYDIALNAVLRLAEYKVPELVGKEIQFTWNIVDEKIINDLNKILDEK